MLQFYQSIRKVSKDAYKITTDKNELYVEIEKNLETDEKEIKDIYGKVNFNVDSI